MTQTLSRPEKEPISRPSSESVQGVLDSLNSVGPVKHLFTVKQYQRMWDEKILDHDKRYELIEGEILEMTQNPPHRYALALLNTLLAQRLAGRVLISPQAPIDLPSDLSKPEPDLVVIPLERLNKQEFAPEHIALLIEVSDSTLRFDQNRKLKVYARYGLVEYWILNIPARTLEKYHTPLKGGYKSKTTLEPGERASCLVYPDLALEWWEALPALELEVPQNESKGETE